MNIPTRPALIALLVGTVLPVGGAYLFAGDFLKNAPNGRGEDVAYAYAQMFLYF